MKAAAGGKRPDPAAVNVSTARGLSAIQPRRKIVVLRSMRHVMRLPVISLLLVSPLLSACSSDLLSSDTKLFPSQVKFFSSQDWATATKNSGPDLIASASAPAE